jgi:hypothetical protein
MQRPPSLRQAFPPCGDGGNICAFPSVSQFIRCRKVLFRTDARPRILVHFAAGSPSVLGKIFCRALLRAHSQPNVPAREAARWGTGNGGWRSGQAGMDGIENRS